MFWRRIRREEAPEEQTDDQDGGLPPGTPADDVPAAAVTDASGPEVAAPADERPSPLAPVAPGGTSPGDPGTHGGGADGSGPVAAPGEQGGATLADGLQASRRGFMARLHDLFRSGTPDETTWEAVEETLIAGDVGARLAIDVVTRARARRERGGPEAAVRAELARILPPGSAGPWRPARTDPSRPAVILVVGVNGTGKTTTIAKIAARLTAGGDQVILAAGDTFRAAAIEQLQAWAERLGLALVAHKAGADPSAVVFDALDAAVARGADVVIVDTAGRLHTRHNLMEELAKIRRTIDRRLPGLVPEVLFVLDGTTGQNGLAQAKAFHEATGLTGIVLTKLDSTSKGGIVFAIQEALGVPVVFAGVGERVGDLVDFDPASFIEALFA
ncbi:MAG: signal recognition particle-docking protein FtsY [Candidatus Limnocylindrales bacterium]